MAEGSDTDTDTDALRRLEERLDRATAAAERLFADAAVAAAGPPGGGDGDLAGPGEPLDPDAGDGEPAANGPPRIPPAGWQRRAPGDGGDRAQPAGGSGGGETELLLAILAALRDRIPPELQQRLADAVREVLLALRALIDWYLERTERQRTDPAPVQDIPIL